MNIDRQRLLVLGATADIARAVAREFAAHGCAVEMAARNPDALQRECQDLRLRSGVEVRGHVYDVLHVEDDARLLHALAENFPGTTICAIGLLHPQRECSANVALAAEVMHSNYTAPARVLEQIAAIYRQAGAGCIIGIASVAGDRGRAANYSYGSAKAGFAVFLSGLRASLQGTGVRVITLKPGFVRTRMMQGRQTPAVLTAAPQELAVRLFRLYDSGANGVFYYKRIWRPIMWLICLLPERLFMRLQL